MRCDKYIYFILFENRWLSSCQQLSTNKMADIFLREDVISLLKDKHVLFIGDSNVRALYKDLVWLYRSNTLVDIGILKRRLEQNFLGDKLVYRSQITRGRDFSEHRQFEDKNITIEFFFVTRCYSERIENLLKEIKSGKRKSPDVIYMNSCLWDVCRWGPNGVRDYKTNMVKLMKSLTTSLPASSLFIWGTALPTASSTSGGLIIKQIEFIQAALRIHVIEANKFTSSLVASYGYDVLDFHHYMHYQIIRRSADGIHFLPPAVRFLTNLFLTHIALSWDVSLPEHLKVNTSPLENEIKRAMNISSKKVDNMVQKMDEIANNLSCAVKAVTAPSKKKKKKKNKVKTVNNKIRNRVARPVTFPMYEKAPHPVFQRDEAQGGSSALNQTPKDFRLLNFNDFSPNTDIQKAYENCRRFNSQCNPKRENHRPTNTYNNRFTKNYGGGRLVSVVNIHNDPYDWESQNHSYSNDLNYGLNYNNYMGNYNQEDSYYKNEYVRAELMRTAYNVTEVWKQCLSLQRNYDNYNQEYGSCNYYNQSSNERYSNNPGPMRARSNVGNRYWTPYERNPYY